MTQNPAVDRDDQGTDLHDPKELRKVLSSTLVGTTVEWYDFFLYGVAAGIIFNKQFFPPRTRSSGPCCPSSPSPSASSPGPSAG